MIDEDLSELPRSALRDYGDDPRLDRVWQRLEVNLGERPPRSRSGLVLAPAFGLLLFAAGVLVGRNVLPPVSPSTPEVLAERFSPAERTTDAPRPAGNGPERALAPLPSSRPRASSPRATQSAPATSASAVDVEQLVKEPVSHLPVNPPGPPEWLKLAESGDFAAARTALEREGGFELAVVNATPEQLLVLVDVARGSGSRERALQALRRLLDWYPGAPEAPLAAWTLGNMLEQGGDVAGAAEAFALYRRLSPAGDFAEDAAARQLDVALAQSNLELATALLEQYAKDFPNGRRLAEFREELAKLERDKADAGPTAPTPEPLPPEAAEPPLAPPYGVE